MWNIIIYSTAMINILHSVTTANLHFHPVVIINNYRRFKSAQPEVESLQQQFDRQNRTAGPFPFLEASWNNSSTFESITHVDDIQLDKKLQTNNSKLKLLVDLIKLSTHNMLRRDVYHQTNLEHSQTASLKSATSSIHSRESSLSQTLAAGTQSQPSLSMQFRRDFRPEFLPHEYLRYRVTTSTFPPFPADYTTQSTTRIQELENCAEFALCYRHEWSDEKEGAPKEKTTTTTTTTTTTETPKHPLFLNFYVRAEDKEQQ